MATLLELALIDDFSYKPTGTLLPTELTQAGWVLGPVRDDSSGYYGVAVFNTNTQELVLGNRGTQLTSITDIITDAALAAQQATQQNLDAQAFAREMASQYTSASRGREKGTFYFFGVLRGRPRGRKVDSRPNSLASCSCQVGEPKGAWRLTQVRIWTRSWSTSGSSHARCQLRGTSSGQGSMSAGCRRLDHGHCSAFEANPARTGLFTT